MRRQETLGRVEGHVNEAKIATLPYISALPRYRRSFGTAP
jgi:hypothetical protein